VANSPANLRSRNESEEATPCANERRIDPNSASWDDPLYMSNCYRCGKRIDPKERVLRRKVRTGEWVRRDYGKRRVQSVQNHFGMRIVCKQCARALDFSERRIEFLGHAQLAVALLVLFGLILYRLFTSR